MADKDKALKIIFSKDVDVAHLSISDTVEEYNDGMDWSYRYLTKDEFDLLKEVQKYNAQYNIKKEGSQYV